jgi:hypothetical protein
MLAVRTLTGLQTIKAVKVRDSGSVLRTCQFVKVRDASNVLRTVWSALTASVSNASPTGIGDSPGAIPITTQTVTASPVGGTAPFTYAWTQTGGETATIGSPTSASTPFTFAAVDPGDSKAGAFSCLITDATGATASVAVNATATNANTA